VNKYDFINFDDHVYITENFHIQSGFSLDSLRWAFTTRYVDLWNPMLWLSFMLDYQLYGLNAGGYHLTNLILHILSTLLLFWLFHRMTGSVWPSAFVAAFFALHPLHVESVAWVSERKDTLSAFFWMLTLCFYVWYTEKPDIKRYMLTIFCFMLALMSKPMVVTLPLILILLDYWPLRRFPFQESKSVPTDITQISTKQEKKKIKQKKTNDKKNMLATAKNASPEAGIALFHDKFHLLEKTPFFILSVIIVIVTLHAPEAADIQPSRLLPLSARLANAPVSFVTYLVNTFWPHDLAVLYPFTEQIPLWQVAVSVLVIIAISAFAIATAKNLPYLFTGWFWFMITILPVIGILQISTAAPYAMADRYHYLPSIGLAFMLAWGLPSLIRKENIRKKILFPTAIIFLGFMAVISYRQSAFWKNSEILFNHALQVTNDNYIAHDNLAPFLLDQGRTKEALDHYNEAIRIKPDYEYAYYNRGIVYDKTGNNPLAIEDYSKAISVNPLFAKAYNNRGLVYTRLGEYQLAITDFNKAIGLNPSYSKAYNNRGLVYIRLGEYQLAITDFNEAISLNPSYSMAYNNRGLAYAALGQHQPALMDFDETIRLKPDDPHPYYDRSTVYAKLGQYVRAIEDLDHDILLKPDDIRAYFSRAVIYLNQGNKESGCWDAQKACELGNCEILKSARSKGVCP
jgi:tetratricopeptide (TPR) repeat protein